VAAVDPGDGQSERLAADQIGELRLSEWNISFFATPGIVDQIAKQRSVRLVALRTLRVQTRSNCDAAAVRASRSSSMFETTARLYAARENVERADTSS